ncbi:hypothetical protein NE686_03825 [Tissierella carlieri]|uniref:Uncharacterized protein n=1 Tax=Tissierella carlieri TaxID=689904 RepID=A0ABT1S6V6_9FIRM|nr:hypothetical protein [Tissierella carlieri]MCQ4922199.1 hypothetical protein [Tissierella carlieri]
MKFKSGCNSIEMTIKGYEFPYAVRPPNNDPFDVNWLNINFKFDIGGKMIDETFPALLTWEWKDIYESFQDVLDGNTSSFNGEFIEPYLIIRLYRISEAFMIKLDYAFDTSTYDDWEYIKISNNIDKKQLIGIINEMKQQLEPFPER